MEVQGKKTPFTIDDVKATYFTYSTPEKKSVRVDNPKNTRDNRTKTWEVENGFTIFYNDALIDNLISHYRIDGKEVEGIAVLQSTFLLA